MFGLWFTNHPHCTGTQITFSSFALTQRSLYPRKLSSNAITNNKWHPQMGLVRFTLSNNNKPGRWQDTRYVGLRWSLLAMKALKKKEFIWTVLDNTNYNFYDCCIFKRFELMTMRLKKSLETSWNVDGKQLRELKSQWTTKFYRFFAKENFHFFLYRHGGPINMQSIAAEEQM